MALVGERGPEIVNLPLGSQVIPNHVLGRGGGGPVSIGGPTINIARADDAGMMRVQQALQRHERTIAAIGKNMSSSQRYQSTGVG
jgi:hypothetical protein